MSSEAPDRNFEAPQQAKQETPAFSAEYVQQLAELKDRMDGKGELGIEGKEKADAKVQREVFKTLNSSSSGFLLVKSEIAKNNFLNGANSAFITESAYKAFAESPEGSKFFGKVVELGTQALKNQYISDYQAEKYRFDKAKLGIRGNEDSPIANAHPTEKLIYEIAEKLRKNPAELTFDEAVSTGMMGIKPPSVEEIVKHGLTELEYVNPRVDRKRYNEIQKRKRKVESLSSANVLTTDDAKSIIAEKSKENTERMNALNQARKSLDADIKALVDQTLSTKDGDLRFYTIDGKEAVLDVKKGSDLSPSAEKLPAIGVALGRNPIATIKVHVRNGRIGFDLISSGPEGYLGFFDANVKKDKVKLVSMVKAMIDTIPLPNKKAPAKSPKEDPDMKWMESLKDSPRMDLTADNVGKLIIGLRKQQPNLAAKSEVMTYIKFKGNFGGLRIKRIAEGDNNRYIAGFIFPPNKQQQATILVPRNVEISDKNSDDMYSGKFLYDEIIAVLEGRPNMSKFGLAEAARRAAEAEPANEISPKYLAQLAEKMDENLMKGKPLQWAFEVNYKGTPAKLTIRRQLISAEKAGMPEKHEGGYVKYEMALLTPPSTQPYGDVLVTDRPVFNDWDDLGAKLYRKLENAVDKKKK